VLSTSADRNGLEFVSTMEANGLPFYGVQVSKPKSHRTQSTEEGVGRKGAGKVSGAGRGGGARICCTHAHVPALIVFFSSRFFFFFVHFHAPNCKKHTPPPPPPAALCNKSQWHPEKNVWEFNEKADGTPYEAIPHSPAAVDVSLYLADFLVTESRKSGHRFSDPAEEQASLIWNYPVFSAAQTKSTSFVQEYIYNF
jgi:hypothetical protein